MTSTNTNSPNFYYPPGGILMGIIIFLELFTYGVSLIVMVYYGQEEAKVFHESRLRLNITIGTINTMLLITSGFFMATGVAYFKNKNFSKAAFFIKLTILGGFLFLGFKSFEFYEKIEAGLTLGTNTFFTFYWLLTVFHYIHVVVGIIILFSILRGVAKGESNIEDIEASAAFWHMCDLIWLLLFPILYLLF
ncbi:cytochrome c oxidase subunit 3 [Maribacter sp.]|uniref:cytochrome c oxidase subunit 3 n=1 Tax=Maribacter sp. TaxID=1897614 RepID=UPI0025C18E51|nr:cytochrome c oxidase subunit 3 [Maribacter sp.]